MPQSERGTALTIFAVAFALLAISNILKPLQLGGDQTGFVLFGLRLGTTGSALAGPLFGIFLLAYARSIWQMRRVAIPLAYAYAGYVVINLILFSLLTPTPRTAGYIAFSIVYSIVAIGVSAGAAVLLSRRKSELR